MLGQIFPFFWMGNNIWGTTGLLQMRKAGKGWSAKKLQKALKKTQNCYMEQAPEISSGTMTQRIQKRVHEKKKKNLMMTYSVNAPRHQDCSLSLSLLYRGTAVTTQWQAKSVNASLWICTQQKKCCMIKGSWIMQMQTKYCLFNLSSGIFWVLTND